MPDMFKNNGLKKYGSYPNHYLKAPGLKVVSASLLLVYFLNLNESTCQTKENVFYFTSKALFVPGKIKF